MYPAEQQMGISERFPKDHVTLKTWNNDAKKTIKIAF